MKIYLWNRIRTQKNENLLLISHKRESGTYMSSPTYFIVLPLRVIENVGILLEFLKILYILTTFKDSGAQIYIYVCGVFIERAGV